MLDFGLRKMLLFIMGFRLYHCSLLFFLDYDMLAKFLKRCKLIDQLERPILNTERAMIKQIWTWDEEEHQPTHYSYEFPTIYSKAQKSVCAALSCIENRGHHSRMERHGEKKLFCDETDPTVSSGLARSRAIMVSPDRTI